MESVWTRRRVLHLAFLAAVAPLLEACGRGIALSDLGLAPQREGDPTAALTADGLSLPADVRALLQSSPVRVTPNGAFYVQTYDRVPQVDAGKWRLNIGGLVERPFSLDYEELLSLPSVLTMRTLECIGNPVGGSLIGNAIWRGVSLAAVIRRAGVQDGPSTASGRASRVIMAAADGYETSVPLETALHPDSLLVYEMNGVPLPAAHGYPVRLLFAGRYGQKQPKWLTDIELSDNANHRGTWERKGWSNDAFVRVNSRIEAPRSGLPLAAGEQRIAGVAFAGARPITTVEVLVNGAVVGTAELNQAPSPLTWTQWRLRWQGGPGQWDLEARATDDSGATQERSSGFLESVFPEGANGRHRVRVRIDA